MGNESAKKLTISDPVDPGTLKRIGEVQVRRYQLGDMLLDMEQEKVKILVEARRLDDERTKLFSLILSQRGLAPGMPVEIDPESGKISLIKMPNGQPAPQAPTAPPPEPAAAAPEAPPAPPAQA